jgi:hypothetical protein
VPVPCQDSDHRREWGRVRRRGLVVSGCAIAGLLLSACGSSPSLLPAALVGKSASQIVALSTAAMLRQSSVTSTADVAVDSLTGTEEIRASLGSAIQVNRLPSGNGTLILIGSHLYVNGDATFLKSSFYSAKDASAYAGKWIYVPTTDSNYPAIEQGTLLRDFVNVVTPIGPLTSDGVVTYHGTKALKITGHVNPAQNQGTTGTVTYYYSLVAPFLPIASTAKVMNEGAAGTISETFGDWGQSLKVTRPVTSLTSTSTGLR